MSEEHSDELTPGEEQVQKELIVAQMAYKECRRQWLEHFYEGQDPGDPQAYDDATITVSRKYSNWDIPEETYQTAQVFVIAVEKYKEALDMVKAEWAYTRDVEELNQAPREPRGEGQDS